MYNNAGCIPPQLGEMVSLRTLMLPESGLTGALLLLCWLLCDNEDSKCHTLCHRPCLSFVWLSGCLVVVLITGPLPTELGGLSALCHLMVEGNELTGKFCKHP